MWTTARDIEACEQCVIPVMPGDEIVLEKDGTMIHVEHTGFSLPALPEPVYA